MKRALGLCTFITIGAALAKAQYLSRYDLEKTKDLVSLAEKYDDQAVTELGRRRERSAIEVLRKIAEEPDLSEFADSRQEAVHQYRRNSSHVQAKIALARMDEGPYFDQFIVGLSSSNVDWRMKCIKYLGEVDDKRAVRYLIPLLDDLANNDRPPEDTPEHSSKRHFRIDRVHRGSISSHAEGLLRQLLPKVAGQLDQMIGEKGLTARQAWKDWWSAHHSEYEK